MKKWLSIGLTVFFLFGCSSDDERKTQSDLDQVNQLLEQIQNVEEEFTVEISKLKEEIEEKDQQIEELKDTLERYNPVKNEYVQNLRKQVDMVSQKVRYLPDIVHRQAYIREVTTGKSGIIFMMDYAQMVQDETAPNHFKIVNDQEHYEKVSAHPGVELYLLNGAVPEYANLDTFQSEIGNSSHKRLFNLYFVGGDLVLVVEQYIP
ncbi:MAG: hypothetical protein H0Z32_12185 [Bacillaceae bacterium]|nr:hypothetical protein [Bacillaceae bacterium]